MTPEQGRILSVSVAGSEDKWVLARRRLFSFEELPGWFLYAFGIVELVAAWPWPRPVGVVAIALGLFDHVAGVRRAWREAGAKA
jgi:hypothetical protein